MFYGVSSKIEFPLDIYFETICCSKNPKWDPNEEVHSDGVISGCTASSQPRAAGSTTPGAGVQKDIPKRCQGVQDWEGSSQWIRMQGFRSAV